MRTNRKSRLRLPVASACATLALAATALTPAAASADQPPEAAAPQAAEVSPHPAQTIDNIGASGAWWVNDLANFSPEAQAEAAKLLFSQGGLDLSSYRYNIGGGGTAVTTPERAPEDFLNDDGSYDWSEDAGGQTFVKYAATYGVQDIIGFVNSAPARWKTNGQSCGGHLDDAHIEDFARYLADVTEHFKGKGVDLDYLSPFNEPANSFAGCGQEGMLVDVGQRGAIVRAVGAELAKRGLGTGLIADESSSTDGFNSEVPQWLAEEGTAQYVAKLAHHTYNNPGDGSLARVYETSKAFGKQPWATEICCFGKGGTGWNKEYDPTIDNALLMSRIIHKDFATAHDSAFHWWTAVSNMSGTTELDTEHGRKNDNGWNDGLLYYDKEYAAGGNQKLYTTKRYYALGQYSKFVKQGSRAHDITGVPAGVEASAYDVDGRWVVVVNNHNTTETPLDLHFNNKSKLSPQRAVRTSATEDWSDVAPAQVDGASASATLTPRSVTTYVLGQGKRSTPTALTGALVGSQSGKCFTGSAINTCTGGDEQQWSYAADGTLSGANGCLTADGSTLGTQDCNGGPDQQWLLNGNGQIVLEADGRCLDVSGQATADGSKVVLYRCNGGLNQSWTRQ
ncbi:glycoside hydrolase [Streptomyces sp. E11-3]|uniref:glycoside hydrolase n=1 Tax=Streptomyces sp. E11-3 TaxID=3110112 RepID=UPI00397F33F8